MLNGVTRIQANQGQIKATKKAMYDLETPTNRFFGSNIVDFNMPYSSEAKKFVGLWKSNVSLQIRDFRALQIGLKKPQKVRFSAQKVRFFFLTNKLVLF